MKNGDSRKANQETRSKNEGPDQTDSGCCSGTGCCDNTDGDTLNLSENTPFKEFGIIIDGRSITVKDPSKRIVEIARDAKIAIPAPCFLSERKYGCCNACVIEINGRQAIACATRPKEGMQIVIKRKDLNLLRKNRLLKYKESIKNGTWEKCGCS